MPKGDPAPRARSEEGALLRQYQLMELIDAKSTALEERREQVVYRYRTGIAGIATPQPRATPAPREEERSKSERWRTRTASREAQPSIDRSIQSETIATKKRRHSKLL